MLGNLFTKWHGICQLIKIIFYYCILTACNFAYVAWLIQSCFLKKDIQPRMFTQIVTKTSLCYISLNDIMLPNITAYKFVHKKLPIYICIISKSSKNKKIQLKTPEIILISLEKNIFRILRTKYEIKIIRKEGVFRGVLPNWR